MRSSRWHRSLKIWMQATEHASENCVQQQMENKKMKKYAFLYAGQGAQKVGMGLDFYNEFETYRKVADSFTFDFDHITLMHEGPMEVLTQTEYTQPCMSVFAAGVTELLKCNGIVPSMAAGLSLGEYGALYAAGVFENYNDYVMLTRFRGMQMAKAAEGRACAMSAVMSKDAELVAKACEAVKDQGYVTVANYNCPGQYVICGEETAVAAAEAWLKDAGIRRCVRLKVSGPFHTKYMQPAGEALKEYFKKLPMGQPNIPVALNYTGDFYKTGESIPELLVAQVQNSVRMEQALKRMLEEDVDLFIEIGPGTTLSGFLNKCAREMKKKIRVITIETTDDFKKLMAECEE